MRNCELLYIVQGDVLRVTRYDCHGPEHCGIVVRCFKKQKVILCIILYCARILIIIYTYCFVSLCARKKKKKKTAITRIQCSAKESVRRKNSARKTRDKQPPVL